MAQGKILIVEDETVCALSLQRILKSLGYETVQITTTGEEAIVLARSEKPDVVLMDINLGAGMDGIQAAEKILLEFGIPVIFMTGYYDEEIIEKATHVNPSAILRKPLDIKMLLSAVKSAIEKTS